MLDRTYEHRPGTTASNGNLTDLMGIVFGWSVNAGLTWRGLAALHAWCGV